VKPIAAVVPIKDINQAKQRLSGLLSAHERETLFRLMINDVLSTLSSCDEIDVLYVVTKDLEVELLAQHYHAIVMREPENLGQTQAVSFAAQNLTDSSMPTLLTVPADVPSIKPRDIKALLASHQNSPAITIAPARDKLGSNALVCSPPDALIFQFGDNSFYPHVARARSIGIEPQIVENHALGLDIDTPEDLLELATRKTDCSTYHHLESSDLWDRLHKISP